jgi:hypothetical protein
VTVPALGKLRGDLRLLTLLSCVSVACTRRAASFDGRGRDGLPIGWQCDFGVVESAKNRAQWWSLGDDSGGTLGGGVDRSEPVNSPYWMSRARTTFRLMPSKRAVWS